MQDQETILGRLLRHLKESPHGGLQAVAAITVLTLFGWAAAFRYESVEHDTVGPRDSLALNIPVIGRLLGGPRRQIWPSRDASLAPAVDAVGAADGGPAGPAGAPAQGQASAGYAAAATAGARAGAPGAPGAADDAAFPGGRPKAPKEGAGLNGAFIQPGPSGAAPGSGAGLATAKAGAAAPALVASLPQGAVQAAAGRAALSSQGPAAAASIGRAGHGRGLGAKGAVGRGTLGGGGSGNFADESEDGSESGHAGIGGGGSGGAGGASVGAGAASGSGGKNGSDSGGGGAVSHSGSGWNCGDGSATAVWTMLRNGRSTLLEQAAQPGFALVTRLASRSGSTLSSAALKLNTLNGSVSRDAAYFGQYDQEAAADLQIFAESISQSLNSVNDARQQATAVTGCLGRLHATTAWPVSKQASEDCHNDASALFMAYDGLDAVLTRVQSEHSQRAGAVSARLQMLIQMPFTPLPKKIWAQGGLARLSAESASLSSAREAVHATLWAGLGSGNQQTALTMPGALAAWLMQFKNARTASDATYTYYWTYEPDTMGKVRETLTKSDADAEQAVKAWQRAASLREGERPSGMAQGDNLSLYTLWDLNRGVALLEPSAKFDARCKLGFPAPVYKRTTVGVVAESRMGSAQ